MWYFYILDIFYFISSPHQPQVGTGLVGHGVCCASIPSFWLDQKQIIWFIQWPTCKKSVLLLRRSKWPQIGDIWWEAVGDGGWVGYKPVEGSVVTESRPTERPYCSWKANKHFRGCINETTFPIPKNFLPPSFDLIELISFLRSKVTWMEHLLNYWSRQKNYPLTTFDFLYYILYPWLLAHDTQAIILCKKCIKW